MLPLCVQVIPSGLFPQAYLGATLLCIQVNTACTIDVSAAPLFIQINSSLSVGTDTTLPQASDTNALLPKLIL